MSRVLTPLTGGQLAEIAFSQTGETTAALAQRIAAPYSTVHKARKRIRDAGGWFCPLTWSDCDICGQPVASGPGSHARVRHAACTREHRRRQAIRRRAEGDPSARSTPYVAKWRAAHPEADAARREREQAAKHAAWPTLPSESRNSILARAHAHDDDAQARTRDQARQNWEPWTPEEDALIIGEIHRPAAELALKLGRTLWAVRHRRVTLRKRGLLGERSRPKRTGAR